ncbi:MAG: BglG family transcription antiterminator [Lactovum sp.]
MEKIKLETVLFICYPYFKVDEMNSLLLKILNSLSESQYTSSKVIAKNIGKSDRTIREKLKELDEILSFYGAHIEIKKAHGFRLFVDDSELFHQLDLEETFESDSIMKKLIQKFLENNHYQKAEDLAEQLFISRSTLTKYLNEFRVYLKQYSLSLKVKPRYGLKLSGSEFNKRRFIASNFAQNYQLNLNSLEKKSHSYQQIYRIVFNIVVSEVSQSKETQMSDVILKNLSSHISVAVLRIYNHSLIDLNSELLMIDEKDHYYQLIVRIIEKVSKRLELKIPSEEFNYIVMQFVSKKVITKDQKESIPLQINQLIDLILLKILEERKLDLRDDLDLRTMLGLHIVPLLIRLQLGSYLKNPILSEVKIACVEGYNLAVIASEIIEDYTKKRLHDHEISYLAMHFDVSLNRKQSEVYLKNILIVCSTGRASGQLLKQKFQQHFSQYLNKIDVCDIHELSRYEARLHYDFIFTTVPFERKTNAPAFEFEFFLDQKSVNNIKSILSNKVGVFQIMDVFQKSLFFVDSGLETKNKILHGLITKVIKEKNLPEEFRSFVFNREDFSSTDILPMMAIPHPNQLISNESFVACLILEKPVDWGNHEVSLVFLLSLAKKDSEKYSFIYDYLLKLANHEEMILDIQKHKSHQSLIDNLLKLMKEK